MKNIFAYTPSVPNPPYLSLNENGSVFQLSVRSEKQTDGNQPQAVIELTQDQLEELAFRIQAYFYKP